MVPPGATNQNCSKRDSHLTSKSSNWEVHDTKRWHLLDSKIPKQITYVCQLLANTAKYANDIISWKWRTHRTDLRWCRLQRPCCRTTCEQQSCGSASVCRSCRSRSSTLSREFPLLPGSSPDSSCWPFVWQSESDTPSTHTLLIINTTTITTITTTSIIIIIIPI